MSVPLDISVEHNTVRSETLQRLFDPSSTDRDLRMDSLRWPEHRNKPTFNAFWKKLISEFYNIATVGIRAEKEFHVQTRTTVPRFLFRFYTMDEEVQRRIEPFPRVRIIVMVAVGIQDYKSEPAGGNCLEDVGGIMIHVELQLLERVDVRQIDTPGEIWNIESDQRCG